MQFLTFESSTPKTGVCGILHIWFKPFFLFFFRSISISFYFILEKSMYRLSHLTKQTSRIARSNVSLSRSTAAIHYDANTCCSRLAPRLNFTVQHPKSLVQLSALIWVLPTRVYLSWTARTLESLRTLRAPEQRRRLSHLPRKVSYWLARQPNVR